MLTTRAVHQLPEPARFWIAYAPRNWRSSANLWTDLANGRISGERSQGAALPDLEVEDFDDLFYLPPVTSEMADARDRLAVEMISRGTPVLVQLLPGETCEAEGSQQVFDLLPGLLEGDVDGFISVPPGAMAVWPLIAGITDRRELWEEGCAVLAMAGARVIQAMTVELAPALRRRLAEERNDDAFDALFHGEPPVEKDFAVIARSHGLDPFIPRLVVGRSPMQIRNRRIAADLALAGELWLRLNKPVNFGNSLFRASRGAESTHHDITALVREENLGLMTWLDNQSGEVVAEIVKQGGTALLQQLLDEYLEVSNDLG